MPDANLPVIDSESNLVKNFSVASRISVRLKPTVLVEVTGTTGTTGILSSFRCFIEHTNMFMVYYYENIVL